MAYRSNGYSGYTGLKRKRGSSASYPLVIGGHTTSYNRRRNGNGKFRRGRDRVSGYYGRYMGINAELKFFDTTLDDAVVAAGATVTDSINLIPQGVTESERVGRKCTVTQILWRYRYFLPVQDAVTLPVSGDTLRIMMYVDKQANGATATSLDLLETANFQSFRHLADVGRFEILVDRTVSLNYTGVGSDEAAKVSMAPVQRNGSFFKKCHIPLEFESTTGAITEIRSNNIGVMLLSSNGIVGFDSNIRIRYSDI